MSEAQKEKQDGWRIVLLTMYPFAYEVWTKYFKEHNANHEIVAIVTARGPKRRRSERFLEVCKTAPVNVDVIISDKPAKLHELVKPFKPDLIVCTGFPWLIRPALLDLPPLGCVNSHNSLLPEYRGPNSFGQAIVDGRDTIAMTLHRISDKFDEGNILAQKSAHFGINNTFDDATKIYMKLFTDLLPDTIRKIAENCPGTSQSSLTNIQASDAPLFDKEYRQVDWKSSALTIHNKIRAFTGDRDIPLGALAKLADGRKVQFIKSYYNIKEDSTISQELVPGTVVKEDDTGLLVYCVDRTLLIEKYEWMDK